MHRDPHDPTANESLAVRVEQKPGLGHLEVVSVVSIAFAEQPHAAHLRDPIDFVAVEALEQQNAAFVDSHEFMGRHVDSAVRGEVVSCRLPGHDVPLVGSVRELRQEQAVGDMHP